MPVYEDEIELVSKLIERENVPTKAPKALATIMVLTAEYGAGDALAGVLLQDLIEEGKHGLAAFIKTILGREAEPHYVSLAECLEVLSKKHKVFKALEEMSASGGKINHLNRLAKRQGVKLDGGVKSGQKNAGTDKRGNK
jgi:hypothetical protein